MRLTEGPTWYMMYMENLRTALLEGDMGHSWPGSFNKTSRVPPAVMVSSVAASVALGTEGFRVEHTK